MLCSKNKTTSTLQRIKVYVGKSMHGSDSATSYWQGQVTKPIPTLFKTFFNRAFDLKPANMTPTFIEM